MRHHRRPAMTTSKWQRDFKSSEGRHGQSSPAINAPARSSAGREARSAPSVGRQEQGPAGDASG